MSVKNVISPETLCLCRIMSDEEQILWSGKGHHSSAKNYKILTIGLYVLSMASFFIGLVITSNILINYGIYYLDLPHATLYSLPAFGVLFMVALIANACHLKQQRFDNKVLNVLILKKILTNTYAI